MPECSIKGESCGFECTGFDGSAEWKKLEQTADSIPCGSCADHAIKLIRFIHDHVNLGLGKKTFHSKNYEEIYNEIICVYNTGKEKGLN